MPFIHVYTFAIAVCEMVCAGFKVKKRVYINIDAEHISCMATLYAFLGTFPIQSSSYRMQIEITWWRHQMETFSALLALCAGNSPVPVEFPAQRPVTRSFDALFDLRLNKRLRKQSWGW